jgi:hypothetical protein
MTSAAARSVGPFPEPMQAEQAAADRGPPIAGRLEDWCRDYGIPLSTLNAIRAKGIGPRTFVIGRLLFCTTDDWLAWIRMLAETGGTGPLSPSVRRKRVAAPR